MRTGRIVAGAVMMVGLLVSGSVAQQAKPDAKADDAKPRTSWMDIVTFKGDLRYRYDSINDDTRLNADQETYTRQRDRVRARLSAEAKVNESAKLGIGLSTGQSDPVAGNQTLGDSFSKKDFKLDLAYFDWQLIKSDNSMVNFGGGKMRNPFMPFGNSSDLVWDPDVTPEGLALKVQRGNDRITIGSNLGYLWIQERSADADDTMLYVGQGYVKVQPCSKITLTLGGTYYGYQEIQGRDVFDWQGLNTTYGNSTVKGTVSGLTTNKAYASEFTPIEIFAGLSSEVFGLPVCVYGQTVKNNDASTDFDSGYLCGLTVGKAKDPRTFEVGYSYTKLEKDAVLGSLTENERWGGGTDGKGSKIYGKYAIAKNFTAGLTFFVDERCISDSSKTRDYTRSQIDLMYSF